MAGMLSVFVHEDDGLTRLQQAQAILEDSNLFETVTFSKITIREFK
jgi:hypothetical protein